jgi:hypothetical protein
MSSHKRAAWRREKHEFLSAEAGYDQLFEREHAREAHAQAAAQEALRQKACASKNRYLTRADAEAVAEECMDGGSAALSVYKCEFCDGWHLTSHPWE